MDRLHTKRDPLPTKDQLLTENLPMGRLLTESLPREPLPTKDHPLTENKGRFWVGSEHANHSQLLDYRKLYCKLKMKFLRY